LLFVPHSLACQDETQILVEMSEFFSLSPLSIIDRKI
jgi:hypothetical protein